MEDYRNYESPGDFFLGLQKGLVSFIKNRIEEVTFVPLKQFQYCVRLGISLNIQLINFSLAKCIRLSVTISKFFWTETWRFQWGIHNRNSRSYYDCESGILEGIRYNNSVIFDNENNYLLFLEQGLFWRNFQDKLWDLRFKNFLAFPPSNSTPVKWAT